ncbi:regulator of microtubule dynamics protein 2 isoform X2 [Bos taurus]|uniref:regulator of microtubule dynamics protein 2 isoform X2 n=1 Tax=Bos taurus TaxID=9913 RepID=UPI0028CB1AE5|nr:regulator of microtubule dynamics protein 2 isoform X2 [Bos taurus]
MGKCLSCYKEEQNCQPKCPADQLPSDLLHRGASSVIQPTKFLDFKAARPTPMLKGSSHKGSKISSPSSNVSFYATFLERRHSLFPKFQKSSTSLHTVQSRANFDSEEKRSFIDLKSASEHFRFRSRSVFSAPKLSIISCYENAGTFDASSSCIFNPNEVEVISKNSNITGAEKYIHSYSAEYDTTYFMKSKSKANSSACRDTVATLYQSTATMLTLPSIISYSSEQHGIDNDIQERDQYVTANTDTEEQSFPVPKEFNTHVEELNLDALIQRADNLRVNESRKVESFELLCDHKEKFRDEIEFIWRFARAYGDMYELSTNIQEKKHYANIGKTLGEKAIMRAPKNGYCHLWYAVLCGYVSEFEGLQNKINYGYRFKEHLDKAIEFLPEEPFLYYLKGRYCYAVEELQPGFSKSNYMFMAKCYADLNQIDSAMKFCNLAVLLPCITKEADSLLSELPEKSKNTGVGSISLLQGSLPTQESNPGLPHRKQILYRLSHQGSPRILEWVAYSFSRGSSPSRNQTRVSCIAGRLFTS